MMSPMRIVIVGSSGSGKTTLARTLGAELGLTFVELDAINWQSGWRDLDTHDPDEFVRQATEAAAGEAWVADGNYGRVRPVLWGRATHLVWLDYSRWVIMPRVLRRSFARALDGRELWPGTGNRERVADWLSNEHPIRWAWDTYHRRRAQYEALLAAPDYAHLDLRRLRHPREAKGLAAALSVEI